jgi:hypothetical protein
VFGVLDASTRDNCDDICPEQITRLLSPTTSSAGICHSNHQPPATHSAMAYVFKRGKLLRHILPRPSSRSPIVVAERILMLFSCVSRVLCALSNQMGEYLDAAGRCSRGNSMTNPGAARQPQGTRPIRQGMHFSHRCYVPRAQNSPPISDYCSHC